MKSVTNRFYRIFREVDTPEFKGVVNVGQYDKTDNTLRLNYPTLLVDVAQIVLECRNVRDE